jgi:hypothetical protein
MVDFVPVSSAVVPLASEIAGNDKSGVSLSGAFLVIIVLVAGVMLFRRFLLPTATSMLGVVKQVFGTPAGRVAGVVGGVVLVLLLLGGL